VRKIRFLKADKTDSEQIADLYRRGFKNYSLKQFTDPVSVEQMVEDEKHIWFVAKDGGKIVGSVVAEIDKWNSSFEIGKTVTHKMYSGRGIAKHLSEDVVEFAFSQGLDILWGTPRNKATYNIAKGMGMVCVGYLPGLHRPGRRENHLVMMKLSDVARRKRVEPMDSCSVYGTDCAKRVKQEMRLGSTQCSYPSFIRGFDRDDNILLPVKYNEHDRSLVIGDSYFSLGECEYLQTTLLSDKEGCMKVFNALGFRMYAFMPAWYEQGSRRYDAVLMANPIVESISADRTIDEVVMFLERQFNIGMEVVKHAG